MVICSPPNAPEIAALEQHLDHLAPEYAMAAERSTGPEGGRAWADGLRGRPVYRLSIVPTWANVLDFEQRFPSALSA